MLIIQEGGNPVKDPPGFNGMTEGFRDCRKHRTKSLEVVNSWIILTVTSSYISTHHKQTAQIVPLKTVGHWSEVVEHLVLGREGLLGGDSNNSRGSRAPFIHSKIPNPRRQSLLKIWPEGPRLQQTALRLCKLNRGTVFISHLNFFTKHEFYWSRL